MSKPITLAKVCPKLKPNTSIATVIAITKLFPVVANDTEAISV